MVTGDSSGNVKRHLACHGEKVAFREYIAHCATSRIKSIEAQCSNDSGANPLDGILNEDKVMMGGAENTKNRILIEFVG